MSARMTSIYQLRRLLKPSTSMVERKCLESTSLKHKSDTTHISGFSIAGIKKNPAVIPLIAIIGVAVTGLVSFCIYSFRTRADVSYTRKGYGYETMDMMNPQINKLRVYNDEYKAMPELHAALQYKENKDKPE